MNYVLSSQEEASISKYKVYIKEYYKLLESGFDGQLPNFLSIFIEFQMLS